MKRILLLLPLLLLAVPPARAQTGQDYHGYAREDFEVAGRAAILVSPKEAHPDRPWIWRARFFDHQAAPDLALLAQGFHLAYVDVAELYGSPRAIEIGVALYNELVERRGLSPRPALIGMSRGGLFVHNFAAEHPERVACIYADNPVCDFKSWPGGLGRAEGNAECWQRCLAAWELDETAAIEHAGNPIDRLIRLADYGVPLLHVRGALDEVVPLSENSQRLTRRYIQLGGPMTVIEKPDGKHHPHGLEDPAPIIKFIIRHTVDHDDYVELRSGLQHFLRARDAGQAEVVFVGGSITINPGWTVALERSWRNRWNEVDWRFVNLGAASLDTTAHAYRLERDFALSGVTEPDLIFVEATVNDATNGRTEQQMLRGMEGVVRQLRQRFPQADIALLHFADPDNRAAWDRGEVPVVVATHERVAQHYGVASLDLSREVAERIRAGEFEWKRDFKNLHPSPFRQRIYRRGIERLVRLADEARASNPGATTEPVLDAPLDSACYDDGHFLPPFPVKRQQGWKLYSPWTKEDAGAFPTRPGFVNVDLLGTTREGATLTLEFEGRAVGLCVLSGPDAGAVTYTVDGGPEHTKDLATRWSAGLHLPWFQLLEEGLEAGPHVLELRVQPGGLGNGVRVVHWLVNR